MFRLTPTDQTWGRQKATVLRSVDDHPWIEYVCWGAWPWSGWNKSYYVHLQKFHGFYSPYMKMQLEPLPDTLIQEKTIKNCVPISTRYAKVSVGNVKPHKDYLGCTPLLSSMLHAIRGYRKFVVTDLHIAASQGVQNMNPLIYAMRESGLEKCSMYFDHEHKYWIQTGALAYMRYKADRKLSTWFDSYYKGQTPSPLTVCFSDAVLSAQTALAFISN